MLLTSAEIHFEEVRADRHSSRMLIVPRRERQCALSLKASSGSNGLPLWIAYLGSDFKSRLMECRFWSESDQSLTTAPQRNHL